MPRRVGGLVPSPWRHKPDGQPNLQQTLPSGVFQANAAWLVTAVIAHNLIRAAAALVGGTMAMARALTIRSRIISIPARIAHRARRLILHLPTGWKWAKAFEDLWAAALGPPPALST